MITVKCNCCGATANDAGTAGLPPFQTWAVTVAMADTPVIPEGQTPPASAAGQNLRIPAGVTHLCLSCRQDLQAGNFANLATKARVERGTDVTTT